MFKLQGGPVSHQRIVTAVKPANEIRVFLRQIRVLIKNYNLSLGFKNSMRHLICDVNYRVRGAMLQCVVNNVK